MLSENLHTHPTFVTSIIIYTLPLIQIIVNVLVPSHIILKNDRAKLSNISPKSELLYHLEFNSHLLHVLILPFTQAIQDLFNCRDVSNEWERTFM